MTDPSHALAVAWACELRTQRFERWMHALAESDPTMTPEARARLVAGILTIADNEDVTIHDVSAETIDSDLPLHTVFAMFTEGI